MTPIVSTPGQPVAYTDPNTRQIYYIVPETDYNASLQRERPGFMKYGLWVARFLAWRTVGHNLCLCNSTMTSAHENETRMKFDIVCLCPMPAPC